MNQCYRIIFSKVRQCFVVVSELTKSHGKGGRASRVLCSVLLGACLAGVGQPVAWGAEATNASVNVAESGSGDASSAWGNGTTATGVGATAFGHNTVANNKYATAWGYGTDENKVKANGYGSTAFGYINQRIK